MFIEDDIFAVLSGGFCSNSYVIVAERDLVLVDPGMARGLESIVGPIRAVGLDIEKIKRVVNTHCHYDHTGANRVLRENLELEFYAHVMDAEYVETGDPEYTASGVVGEESGGVPVAGMLKDGDLIGGTGFKVLHTPGHTKGSICLWDEERKILISGDCVFAAGVGRYDLPGGDLEELVGSLERLAKLDVEKLLPGHGECNLTNGSEAIQSGLDAVSQLRR